MKPEIAAKADKDQNFTFQLLPFIDRDLATAIEQGCFLKKALLARILSKEIERLNDAITVPCSAEVKSFVRAQQNHPMLKERWKEHQVLLPTQLVARIQEVCANKGVIRDAFVNRALFLATARISQIESFFALDEFKNSEYFNDKTWNREAAYDGVWDRLGGALDPIAGIHRALVSSLEPEWTSPGYLYRQKIFVQHPEPKEDKPTSYESKASEESKAVRRRWEMHLIFWCMTCWAELADIDRANLVDQDWLSNLDF